MADAANPAMKLIILLAMASSAAAAQQERPEPEMVVSGDIESGGYGGPEMRYTSVRGEGAVFLGGRGGWIINHTIVLGGAGYGLVSQIAAPDAAQPVTGPRYDLSFGYIGPFIEAIVLPQKLWHLSIASLFAAGELKYRIHDGGDVGGNSSVFVWEPSATVEINVVRFMRIDVGASWRMVRGVDRVGLRNSDLTGFSGLLAFKFGRF